MTHPSLTKYARLSIAAACITIALKLIAYQITHSVGLLSDALESIVNLVAAVMALIVLHISERPPDDDHMYGHSKIEYFSSIFEGVLIVATAIWIFFLAGQRLIRPLTPEISLFPLVISMIASIVNGLVATILLRAGKKHRAIILTADAHHLLTDVWTSIGVLVGIVLVWETGWSILDPLIAIVVAGNIIFTGISLVKSSADGFMDRAIDSEDMRMIRSILQKYCQYGIEYHGVRSRISASRLFVSFHILVPGSWTVQKGHNLLEEIEMEIHRAIPKITVFSHLEPIEDPRSLQDQGIDRT